jgi:hypothetical protein
LLSFIQQKGAMRLDLNQNPANAANTKCSDPFTLSVAIGEAINA